MPDQLSMPYWKSYYLANRDRILKQHREYKRAKYAAMTPEQKTELHRKKKALEKAKASSNPALLNKLKAQQREYCSRYRNKLRLSGDYKLSVKKGELGRYGLTIEKFTEMATAQNGLCAVCSSPPRHPYTTLHVDHCHRSGDVRALLCHTCNAAMGLLSDSSNRCYLAAKYLERWGS